MMIGRKLGKASFSVPLSVWLRSRFLVPPEDMLHPAIRPVKTRLLNLPLLLFCNYL